MCMPEDMWRSEDNPLELVLCSHHRQNSRHQDRCPVEVLTFVLSCRYSIY